MSSGQIILDNSILSAFAVGDWLHNLSFWEPQYELYTTKRIWAQEFQPHHTFSKPNWLQVETVDTSKISAENIELGKADWSLIRLAETLGDPILVSNDKRLLDETERRGLDRIWGSRFLMQTFESCGIDKSSYESGLPSYINDIHIPEFVANELRSAEKK